ncbi:MAG: hypothetical protein OEY51_08255 [Cyclobacteriaceae bacterium]|nr:hypothetical protein [Cyclobacteriaceae bacterium]
MKTLLFSIICSTIILFGCTNNKPSSDTEMESDVAENATGEDSMGNSDEEDQPEEVNEQHAHDLSAVFMTIALEEGYLSEEEIENIGTPDVEISGEEHDGSYTLYYFDASEYHLRAIAPGVYSIIHQNNAGDCLGDNDATVHALKKDGTYSAKIDLPGITVNDFWGDQPASNLEDPGAFIGLQYAYVGEGNNLTVSPTLFGDEYCFEMAIGGEKEAIKGYENWLEKREIQSFTLTWDADSKELIRKAL